MSRSESGATVFRVFLAVAFILFAGVSICAQSISTLDGQWVWKEPERKNKPQVQFTLTIRRKGDVIRGVYSVDKFIDGVWQGEDGNQTPFQGRAKGDTSQIEFDPSATVPGYQENVTYSAPSDGRKPSIATITLNGQTLLWRVTSGPRIEGVPSRLALRRKRRN